MASSRNALIGSLAAALVTAHVNAAQIQVSALYTPAIPVIPLVHSGKVLVQDYALSTYRFRLINASTAVSSEARNNQSDYLYPSDFGGTHIGWIAYSAGSGGSGSSGTPGGGYQYAAKLFTISGAVEQSATASTAYKELLAVDNSTMVWTDYRNFTVTDTIIDVYAYTAGGSERRITTSHSYKSAPFVRGDHVLWQDYRNKGSDPKNADIYLYTLSTSSERAICTHAGYQDQPSISGNYVVWQDYRNATTNPKNADIYLYDLSTGQERAICTAPGFQCNPQVYGNIVVWQDYRNAGADTANADIYLYDMSTGTEQVITTKAGYQEYPRLYDGVVAWFDYTDSKVYIARVTSSSVVARSPLSRGCSAERGAQVSGVDRRGWTGTAYTVAGRATRTMHREGLTQGMVVVDR